MSEAAVLEAPTAAPAPAATPTAAPAVAPVAPAEDGQPAVQNTPESAPETPKTDDRPEERPGKNRAERKISRLYREAAEAKAERDLLRRQLEELKPKPVEQNGRPTLDQFNYDPEKYAEATAKFEREQAIKEYESKQREQLQHRERQRIVETWEEKTSRAESKYEDFDEVVGEIQPTTPWAIAVMEVENGEDVAYHLGKNLKDARRIASLPPLQQALEIGRLSAKLASAPAQPKTPSRAPAPISPLTGAAPVLTDQPSEADDMKTWMRKRSKQVHGR